MTDKPEPTNVSVAPTQFAEEAAARFLRETIENNINAFRQRRTKNRQIAFIIKMIVAFLGAITTILIGLQNNALFSNITSYLSAFALVTSAGVTIVAAWEAFLIIDGCGLLTHRL
jgi:hypothetical protein